MTIKNLGPHLRKKHPEAYEIVSLDHFAGTAVSFDAGNLIFIRFRAAYKKIIAQINPFTTDVDDFLLVQEFLTGILQWFDEIIELDITPVLVYDGVFPEAKRQFAHKSRAKGSANYRSEREELERLNRTNPFKIGPKQIARYRELLTALSFPSKEHVATLKRVITSLGIPTLQAEGEAERLASALVREGYCSAVFSSDYDCLVHGAHTVIHERKNSYTGKDGRLKIMVEVISLRKVLSGLELSFKRFVEFAICCGCDYNTNMPDIGVVKVLALMKRHESLSKLAQQWNRVKDEEVLELLNYPVASKLFWSRSVAELVQGEFGEYYQPTPEADDPPEEPLRQFRINSKQLPTARAILKKYQLDGHINSYVHKYMNLTAPTPIRPKVAYHYVPIKIACLPAYVPPPPEPVQTKLNGHRPRRVISAPVETDPLDNYSMDGVD